MPRVTGLWVYQTLGHRPHPETIVTRAQLHGIGWLTAQATRGDEILGREWLRAMRRATRAAGMRLAVHGYVGVPRPRPAAEARALASAIDIADADFAIVNAEKEYERSPHPDSRYFVEAFRDSKPDFRMFFSSFGRPESHPNLDWQAWADGGFRGMPQAYENLNEDKLKPAQCVDAWSRFFERGTMRPTLGCFTAHGRPHLPVRRLVESVRDVPRLRFNIFRHGTVTTEELRALARID